MLEDRFVLEYHLIDLDDQLPVCAGGVGERDPSAEGALLAAGPILPWHGVRACLADGVSAGE